jgi:hypothetical protein
MQQLHQQHREQELQQSFLTVPVQPDGLAPEEIELQVPLAEAHELVAEQPFEPVVDQRVELVVE